MSKASSPYSTPNPSRRSLLALLPAATLPMPASPTPAPAAPAVAVAARTPDARLLRLCTAFVADDAEMERILSPYYGTLDDEPTPAETARIAELVDRRWRIRELVARLPARTPEGATAKAKMILSSLGEPYEGEDVEDKLARSLVNDVLRQANDRRLWVAEGA